MVDRVWIVTNTLNVPASAADHIVDAFRTSLKDMEALEGFRGLELWRGEDGTILAVTRWASREAFQRYPRSEAFQRHHAGVAPGPGGMQANVSQYETLL